MLLEAKGISRVFFRAGKNTNIHTAVKKTDLTLQEGRITAIIGRSGSGKTTLSNMLSGLLTPTEGTVFCGGVDVYGLDDKKRSEFRNKNIGIIPQTHTGLQSLTVLENVIAPAVMYGNGDKTDKAISLLETLGIAELCDVYSNELSGGELRRMAIARALINDPAIIIADEPTGDIDEKATEQVLKIFKAAAKNGASVLMITHEKGALKVADLVYSMENGVLSVADTDSYIV